MQLIVAPQAVILARSLDAQLDEMAFSNPGNAACAGRNLARVF